MNRQYVEPRPYVLYLDCLCCIAVGPFTYREAMRYKNYKPPKRWAYDGCKVYDVINEEWV